MTRKFTLALWLCTFLSPSAFGLMQKGTFTTLDRWGGAPPISQKEQAYYDFLKGAKKGGKVLVAVSDDMDLIWPAHFQYAIEKKTMPYFNGFIYETLMEQDPARPDRQLVARLAKNFDSDPETSTYTVHLRDDVRFSDGTPVRAEDFLTSYKMFRAEIDGPAHKSYWDGLWGNLELKAVDAYTLRIRFPDIPPAKQRESLYELLADVKLVKKNTALNPNIKIPYEYLGTGPYEVVAADRGHCLLRRRADYWLKGEKDFNFDEIQMTVLHDTTVQREALKRRDLNFFSESDIRGERELDPYLDRGLYKKNEIPVADDEVRMNILNMNMDREHIRDPRFRKALLLAMNWDDAKMVLFANKLSHMPAPGSLSSFSPKGLPSEAVKQLLGDEIDTADARTLPYEEFGYLSTSKIAPRRDRLLTAAKLLKQAGYVVDPGSMRLTKDGRPVTLSLLAYEHDPYKGLYLLFAKNLDRLGIQLDIRDPSDAAAYIAEVKGGRHDLIRNRIEIPHAFTVLDADVLTQRLHSKYASTEFVINFANNKSKAMDAILETLHTTPTDSPAYGENVDALLRLMSAKMPFIMLGERDTVSVYAAPEICLPPTSSALLQTAYYCR